MEFKGKTCYIDVNNLKLSYNEISSALAKKYDINKIIYTSNEKINMHLLNSIIGVFDYIGEDKLKIIVIGKNSKQIINAFVKCAEIIPFDSIYINYKKNELTIK